MIRIQDIRTLDELDSIKNIWIELEKAQRGSTLFQSWLWNRTWCDYFLGSNQKSKLDVRLLEDSKGKPLALLPFFKKPLVGPLLHLTQFLGHRMSFHNDILLAEPGSHSLAGEVVEALLEDEDSGSILHLRHLNEESLFTKELIRRGIGEPLSTRVQVLRDPAIVDQAMRFGQSTRKTYRHRANKLRREVGFEIRVRRGDELWPAFDGLVKLHLLRFDSKNRSSRFQGENLAFRKAVMKEFEKTDTFEVVELLSKGETVASTLMALDKKHYFCIQTGFDPAFARYAPLRLLLTETMSRGFNELACQKFDFGPGYEEYKFAWKPFVGKNYFCCIGGRGLLTKPVAALYRYAFLKSLPQPPERVSRK